MTTTSLTINFERLKQDIFHLSTIGKSPEDNGIYRQAFSKEDLQARQWLGERLQKAGINSTMDGAANVLARIGDPEAPSITVGSHLDTVACAGALDGALGVLVGLECLRTIHEQDIPLTHPLELIAFSDEEGRFGGMLGSQATAGMLNPGFIQHAMDLDGISLVEVMEQQGMNPMGILDCSRTRDSLLCFLELHIEQGPVLDTKNLEVGIVSAITGLFKWQITLSGTANHAGTTPMTMRQDAFMGLADFAHEIPRILDENGGENSRATIGKVELFPGSPNTIPEKAIFSIDVRDTDVEVLKELQLAIRKALSAIARKGGLMFEFEELSFIHPVQSDVQLVNALEKKARMLDYQFEIMPSGAAHDAQIMANLCPVAMVFVPSKGGVSHSPNEWTDWAFIEKGANLLLHTILELQNQKFEKYEG
ncbi:Zn-dependent hydrolase [Rapidithrix thailandica]|uniref:Zn-dependent hydrolase n=1 Tax=Rapidithrix thailandica TaxID=413964 RepID=A0AAW9SCL4_9BACT